MTQYVILQQDESGYWTQFGRAEGSSGRRALTSLDDVKVGTYIAVPARSWRPLKVKVEQTTRVTVTW